MSAIIDAIITYRIMRIFVTPWTSQPAYKLGIIDERGNKLKKVRELSTRDERDNYTILHRMVFKLKRIIEKVPGENKNFITFATAIAMLKEEDMQRLDDMLWEFDTYEIDSEKVLTEVRDFLQLEDTAPTNVGGEFSDEGGIAKVDAPLLKHKLHKRPLNKRAKGKKKEED